MLFSIHSVERLQGSFGTVQLQVTSYLLNTSTNEQTLTSTSSDLDPTTVQLIFSEDETSKTFDLEILDEETPEFEESFELQLTIEDTNGDSQNGARLGSFSATQILVSQNDDPHGLFAISTSTNNVEVAEDVEDGEEGGSVEVQVERRFGDYGSVQVKPISHYQDMGILPQWLCYSLLSGDLGTSSRAGSPPPVLH